MSAPPLHIERIDTPRLTLVPAGPEHLADLLQVNGDDAVTRYLPYDTWRTPADGVAWLERNQARGADGSAVLMVILRKPAPSDAPEHAAPSVMPATRAIGTLLLFRYDAQSRRAELGYVLGRAWWRQGLMLEAVHAALAHAFGPLALRRVEAEANPANEASCRLLLKAGFRHEGTLRQRWFGKGAVYDANFYGLLADEYPAPPGVRPAA